MKYNNLIQIKNRESYKYKKQFDENYFDRNHKAIIRQFYKY